MSTETTNKKIKIDNGTTFGKTYTDKAVDERLQGLVSTATFTPVKEKANNSLQKPAGLTKTELVGVGTNGQENIEIGDNLTLANGKLSAAGGGSSENDNLNILYIDTDATRIYGDYDNNKENIAIGTNRILFGTSKVNITDNVVTSAIMEGFWDVFGQLCSFQLELNFSTKKFEVDYTKLKPVSISHYSHFITMTDSTSNVALYLTIQNVFDTQFTANKLAEYLAGKKVLANGNLHGVVPTYITGEGGSIKIYYRTPGDNNINPTPDEYQDLSSFTITDLVTPVE